MKINRLAIAVALSISPVLANSADTGVASGSVEVIEVSIKNTSAINNQVDHYGALVKLQKLKTDLAQSTVETKEFEDALNKEGIRAEIEKELKEKYAAENTILVKKMEYMSLEIEKMTQRAEAEKKSKKRASASSSSTDDDEVSEADFAISSIMGFKGNLRATVHFEGRKITVTEHQVFAPKTYFKTINSKSAVVVTGKQKFTLFLVSESMARKQTKIKEPETGYDPSLSTQGQLPMNCLQPMLQLPPG